MPIELSQEDIDFMLLEELKKIEGFIKEVVDEIFSRYGKHEGSQFIEEHASDQVIKMYMLAYIKTL